MTVLNTRVDRTSLLAMGLFTTYLLLPFFV
jgi:hypothetical protein